MRIYLDMCCYNRPYDDQAQLKVAMETQSKLHIQMLIREKKLELVVSYMLRYECSKNPFEMRRNAIFDFMHENAAGYMPVMLLRQFMPDVNILYLQIHDCLNIIHGK